MLGVAPATDPSAAGDAPAFDSSAEMRGVFGAIFSGPGSLTQFFRGCGALGSGFWWPARPLPSVSVQGVYRGSKRVSAAIRFTVRSPLQFWVAQVCRATGAVGVLGLHNLPVEMTCIARVHALKRESRALVGSCMQQE